MPADVPSINAANSTSRQIWNGLKYLHNLGMTHGDLTLDNIMVAAEGSIKINCLRQKGLFNGTATDMQAVGKSADIHSMSVILWEVWNKIQQSGRLDSYWQSQSDRRMAEVF
eukprot:m.180232 g.180232  ORF g.180232 m.180232 type:complete len:112 (+) comp39241_c0_seq21:3271-3606(+)